jgi:hypothetical protein
VQLHPEKSSGFQRRKVPRQYEYRHSEIDLRKWPNARNAVLNIMQDSAGFARRIVSKQKKG